MKNAYIEMAYEADGRVVEGQCSGLARFIGSGLAKPTTDEHGETFMAWLDDQDEETIEALKAECERIRPPQKAKHERAEEPEPELDIEPAADVDEDELEPDEPETPAPDTEPTTTDDDPGDGWPEGVTFDRKGAYFALTGSDGKPIESDAPSGKFLGENAAQEAAWAYERALS